MWPKVAEAMKQLAANPLFAANPECLGELLERLVHGAAAQALMPEMVTPSPVKSTSGSSDDGGTDGVAAYKSYWSKFKRASHPTNEPVEKTPKRDVVVVDTETPLKEQLPDNQLGDSGLYPPTPPLNNSPEPSNTAEAASTPADTPQVEQMQAAVVPEPALTETKQVPEKIESTPGHEHGSESFQREMDEMFGPTQTPGDASSDDKKLQFSPTAADVSACLLRKTTADLSLATGSLPGHCQVLMRLADTWQPVWVPLEPEQAKAAGLQLYDATAAVASTEAAPVTHGQAPAATPVTHGQPAAMTPQQTGTPGQIGTPASAPAEKTPGQSATTETEPTNTPSGQVPPGEPRPSNNGQSNQPPAEKTQEAEAKAALRNGYMRFHRSVTSALDECFLKRTTASKLNICFPCLETVLYCCNIAISHN